MMLLPLRPALSLGVQKRGDRVECWGKRGVRAHASRLEPCRVRPTYPPYLLSITSMSRNSEALTQQAVQTRPHTWTGTPGILERADFVGVQPDRVALLVLVVRCAQELALAVRGISCCHCRQRQSSPQQEGQQGKRGCPTVLHGGSTYLLDDYSSVDPRGAGRDRAWVQFVCTVSRRQMQVGVRIEFVEFLENKLFCSTVTGAD